LSSLAWSFWTIRAFSLTARADVCLYAAKRSGRNRLMGEADSEANQAVPKVA
jgi:hypothetical protein